MAHIGERIKIRRRALGISQEELAQKLGLTQANISRIEASLKGPSAEMLITIAEVFGCDVRELMGVEEPDLSNDIDEDARLFVLNAMKSDPQLGLHLRSFVKKSDSMSDDDWKFLAASLKLAIGYASNAIEAKNMKINF